MSGRDQLPSGLVTFMFTDIEGSTRLARLLGSRYAGVLGEHRAVLRRALAGHGGTEMFTEGDSFFVAFGDAAAAVRAGVAAQQALADHLWSAPECPPKVRIGLHTGRAEPVDGEYANAEVHRAARIAAAAHGGQVLCSAATTRHARLPPGAGLFDLGDHRLRGFDDTERLFQVVAPGLRRRFPRPRTPRVTRHDLPAPLTPLVGRRAEQATVADLVRGHRLVTIAGAGGTGKTRLALAVAGRLLGAYPQGVWFADLAEVRDPADVAAAVAAAWGLRPEPGRPVVDTLTERLAGGRTLLVLDTCDAHPAAAAGMVLGLLAGAAGLTVLATSREPLVAHGELVWRIPPLSVRPGPEGGPADAVSLLLDRVVAARGGGPVSPGETADLRRVAERLEGVPLALELAAARLRTLTAGQLVGRLDDPLDALDPAPGDGRGPAGRHRSLASSLGWSCRTLSPGQRRLLGGLAVFAGPVDLATVEYLGGRGALAELSVLADKSLVEVVTGPSGARYRMSAVTRAHTVAGLAADGAERAAREAQVAWSLRALYGTRVGPDGRPRTLSLAVVAPFVAEWQAALSFSATSGRAGHGLRLAVALDPWWREHDRSAEARGWLTRLWARLAVTGERVPDAEAAAAHLVHAEHAVDPDQRTESLSRAESAARRAGDSALVVRAAAGRHVSLVEVGRVVEAERVCRDAIRRAERLGVPEAALPAVVGLAGLLWRRGALDDAAELLGGARQVEAGHCDDRGRRTVDMLLGLVALRRGDLVAAHDHLVVALRSRMRHGFRREAAETVNALAVRCGLGGEAATAATLFGAGEVARGAARPGWFAAFCSQQQAVVRAAVGDAVFDPAYAAGARLDLDAAVAIALSVEHPDLALGSARFGVDARAPG